MPKYDHFSLMLADTPNGWTPVVNQAEREYLRERFEKIEKSRKEENEKSLLKCRENDNDFEARMNTEIPEPQPNPRHPYCQICNENYASFPEHVASENHRKKTLVQVDAFRDIDNLFADLTARRKWETIVNDPVQKEDEDPIYSQFSAQINRHRS